MPAFDECCVLIPAATLEDFPAHLPSDQARSLLAGWTVLWHPALLTLCEQLPAWYRADAPPEPAGRRLISIPLPSLDQLPAGYQSRAAETEDWVISGGDRQEMLDQLRQQIGERASEESADSPLARLGDVDAWRPLTGTDRTIAVEDFYAAGYAMLQIQVMTRRLRYTSNLDEVHLQNRLVAAAKAFLDGKADEAIDSAHDVFDALAEERDHYFSSDPHLIDLTLSTPSTVEALLEEVERWQAESTCNPADDSASAPPLATERNVLIDAAVAAAIAARAAEETATLRQQIANRQIGWAGGGPADDPGLDAMSLGEAEAIFVDAWKATRDAIGCPPPVYGRFSGVTPADMTRTLATLGYCGVIPLDFAGGRGHGDEAKVILQAGGTELEALTAKPIDAADDASFLSLGAKLGEAIDSGEIATGLLAHWPGKTCPAMEDVRRVASWCLALGRFWNLEDYFRSGEHPYHHGSAEASSSHSSQLLDQRVSDRVPDPISALADQFTQRIIEQQHQVMAGMASLVSGQRQPPDQAAVAIAKCIAGDQAVADARNTDSNQTGDQDKSRSGKLLINSHSIGSRHQTTIKGNVSASPKQVYGVSRNEQQTDVTVDIPACGFAAVRPDGSARGSRPLKNALLGLVGRGPTSIVEGDRLRNEFMEVTLHEETGGISGVYSGERGNRFSMRLVRNRPAGESETEMQCGRIKTVLSTPAIGIIESRGEIADVSGGKALAEFVIKYTLQRGSRFLRVDVELNPNEPVHGDPWHQYYAARVAIASEAAICRALIRDKVHRVKSRRVVSPLGIVVDEAERQTLIAAGGLAFHRRVGDRFVDTLLRVQSETRSDFTLHYGFDVSSPVAASRMLLSPAKEVLVNPTKIASDLGWFVHSSPKDVLVSSLHVDRREDGSLAAIVRLVQTRPRSCKATVRFLHNVAFARALEGTATESLNLTRPDDDSQQVISSKGDAITLDMESHGVADVLVVFK